MIRALWKNFSDVTEEQVGSLRDRMNQAARDCLVEGYEPLVEILDLPDPDDRHVLAAAIKAAAQVIVTRNVRDFPKGKLARWGVRAKSPDDFVRDQIEIDSRAVWACIQPCGDLQPGKSSCRARGGLALVGVGPLAG